MARSPPKAAAMRKEATLLLAVLSLAGCGRTGHEGQCAPMPSARSLSRTPSGDLWKLVDNYRLCAGDHNFLKEEAVLRTLIDRKDARAMFELGSELKSGSTHRQEGDKLERAAADLGYPPAQQDLRGLPSR